MADCPAPHEALGKPHAVTCITESVAAVLSEFAPMELTVSCDRADCWEDKELFQHRCALNVYSTTDFIGESVSTSRRTARKLGEMGGDDATRNCLHEARLNVAVSIFVAQCNCPKKSRADKKFCCMKPKAKAYSVLSWVSAILREQQQHVIGRRILYQGSTYEHESMMELNIAAVTGSFEVHYLFNQARPWEVE